MGLVAKKGGDKEFKDISLGTHIGRLIGIIDLGTQSTEWEGNQKWKEQVYLNFEIPGETLDNGQPMTKGKFYTLSLDPKSKLHADLVGWRGRDFTEEELEGFSLVQMAGMAGMLNIVKNKKDRHAIAGIMPIPKGMPVPPAHNDITIFDISKSGKAEYEKLPDFLKETIAKSKEMSE